MEQLILVLIPLPLVAFWVWMFWDMTNNRDLPGNSPAGLTWPPSSKYDWTVAFVFLNIFAAGLYYFNEYRNR